LSLGAVSTGPLTNSLFVVGVLALGLNEAAYAAELVRAGIISVDAGQAEAASSLGMSPTLIMRRIVLPQAMRVIIPTMGNETISMLKTTSLLAVLGGGVELFGRLQIVYSQTFQIIPLLVVACIWYLAITTVLTIGQHYLEAYFGKGFGQKEAEAAEKRAERRAARGHA
jgi:polar amino acid transport system permease protein